MITSDSPASASNPPSTKRGRKPMTGSNQVLAVARKNLTRAQDNHKKALARVEQERKAELGRKGRQVYLAAVEQLHVGERALIVDAVLANLAEHDRQAVQAWMDLLASN